MFRNINIYYVISLYIDITFANALLQKAKHTVLINKHNLSTIDKHSCLKTNINNINTNIQLDDSLSDTKTDEKETNNNASDIENEINILNIGMLKLLYNCRKLARLIK